MLVIRAHFLMFIHDVYFSGEMTSMTLGWGVGDPLSDDPGGLLGGSLRKKKWYITEIISNQCLIV